MRLPVPAIVLPACLAAALALSACGADPNETAVQCPKPYLLPDATALSRYNGAPGATCRTLVLSARLTDVR